ncbi:prepilin peptidase [uncultured Cetobacterium sp.]|uniref:prepilin peptidase n=1 Tax=uncultured Cetobacterium sp. TaxID=527638 RepID=UPI002625CF14|nr:prepilin peptidase [uncultured Cetobacterium sp.]
MVKVIVYFFIVVILLEIIIRDVREKIILNKSNLALLFLGIILGFLEGDLQERILGAALYTLPFILIYGYGSDILNKECIGMGDVKLVTSLGFLLKFDKVFDILIFLNISFITPLIYLGGKYIFLKKLDKDIAFGPFLILSYFLVIIKENYGKW